jgi:hypothetical protein
MSCGNIEETRREAVYVEDVIAQSALVSNAVLRRALAIAAYERAGIDLQPDKGIALMIDWVMRASDEVGQR